MKNKIQHHLFLLAFIVLTAHAQSYCQGNYSIGVNAAVEKNPHYSPNYRVGINVEKQYCQKNSIGIEIGYRHFKNDFSNEQTSFVFLKNFSISESFLSVSLLNKYHFKYFNITFGPSADYLFDWANKSEVPYPYLEYLDRKVYYGFLIKVNKTIAINNKISIEPEIRYNPIFSPFTLYSKSVSISDRQYLGLVITENIDFS